jgi:hypothetical protein
MAPRATNYDSAKVSVTVNGVPLSGFAKGSKVKVSRNENSFDLTVGGDGEGCWDKGNDRSGKIEVRLMYASLSNAYLSGLLQVDELTGNILVPVMVRDAKGATTSLAVKARIVKPPELDIADKPTDITWEFKSHNVEIYAAGLP